MVAESSANEGINSFSKELIIFSANIDQNDEPEEDRADVRVRRGSISATPFYPDRLDDVHTSKKPPDLHQKLLKSIQNCIIFQSLQEDELNKVVDVMVHKFCNTNDIIFNQNDSGDHFYVVEVGTFKCFRTDPEKGEELVNLHKDSGYFGEIVMLYNEPRSYSVLSVTEGKLWTMNREAYRTVVLKTNYLKKNMYDNFLNRLPLLEYLNGNEKAKLADVLLPCEFKTGEIIFNQGDSGDGIYFIVEGTVCVMVKDKCTEIDNFVKELSEGQYFGEIALLTNRPRTASVIAKDSVKLAFLRVDYFERLLGPCMGVMMRNIDDYEDHVNELFNNTLV